MKKFIALILAMLMVLALCACGTTAAPAEKGNEPAASEPSGSEDAAVETVELKLGHPLAPTSSQHIYL